MEEHFSTQEEEEELAVAARIQVVVRVRPLLPPHDSLSDVAVACEPESGRVQVTLHERETGKPPTAAMMRSSFHRQQQHQRPPAQGRAGARAFEFDACLPGGASQAAVYDVCGAEQLVAAALDGYSATVFAYGQTGSGKTHTIIGPRLARLGNNSSSSNSAARAAAQPRPEVARSPSLPQTTAYLQQQKEQQQQQQEQQQQVQQDQEQQQQLLPVVPNDADTGSSLGGEEALLCVSPGDDGCQSPVGAEHPSSAAAAAAASIRASYSASDDDDGLLPRCVAALFDAAAARAGEADVCIAVSACEVYNDFVVDLLDGPESPHARQTHARQTQLDGGSAPFAVPAAAVSSTFPSLLRSQPQQQHQHQHHHHRPPLQVREDPQTGEFYAAGLSSHAVADAAAALALLAPALARRATRAHRLNSNSSRSHCLIALDVRAVDRRCSGGARRSGRLSLVDLAGSERLRDTAAAEPGGAAPGGNSGFWPGGMFGNSNSSGSSNSNSRGAAAAAELAASLASSSPSSSGPATAAVREAGAINRSLFVLGQVLGALSARGPRAAGHRHVPYRDAPLTKLLWASLRGTGRTLMVACVAPGRAAADETLSTLNFAATALRVTGVPVPIVDAQDAAVAELRATVRGLRRDIASLAAALHAVGQPGADVRAVMAALPPTLLQDALRAGVAGSAPAGGGGARGIGIGARALVMGGSNGLRASGVRRRTGGGLVPAPYIRSSASSASSGGGGSGRGKNALPAVASYYGAASPSGRSSPYSTFGSLGGTVPLKQQQRYVELPPPWPPAGPIPGRMSPLAPPSPPQQRMPWVGVSSVYSPLSSSPLPPPPLPPFAPSSLQLLADAAAPSPPCAAASAPNGAGSGATAEADFSAADAASALLAQAAAAAAASASRPRGVSGSSSQPRARSGVAALSADAAVAAAARLPPALAAFPALAALEAAYLREAAGVEGLSPSSLPPPPRAASPARSPSPPPVLPPVTRLSPELAGSVTLPASASQPRSLLPVRMSAADGSSASDMRRSAAALAAAAAESRVRPPPASAVIAQMETHGLQQQRQQQDPHPHPQQQQQQQPEPAALAWARANPWFGADAALTAAAYAAHGALAAARADLASPAYYAAIEAAAAAAHPALWAARATQQSSQSDMQLPRISPPPGVTYDGALTEWAAHQQQHQQQQQQQRRQGIHPQYQYQYQQPAPRRPYPPSPSPPPPMAADRSSVLDELRRARAAADARRRAVLAELRSAVARSWV